MKINPNRIKALITSTLGKCRFAFYLLDWFARSQIL